MEYRRRHSLLAQKFRRFHLFLQIRRADYEIRLVGEKQLLVNGFARSVIHQKDVLRGEARSTLSPTVISTRPPAVSHTSAKEENSTATLWGFSLKVICSPEAS